MKSSSYVCLLIASLFAIQLSAQQNVGIGTTTPDASAVLDVKSTNKGVLLPRMTTQQRNAIANPAPGLQILNIDDMCTDTYDGTGWIKSCGMKIIGPGIPDPSHPDANSWYERTNFPAARSRAVGFAIGSRGYICTGLDAAPSNALWEYIPLSNSWSQRANFPGGPRYSAVSFTIDDKAYVGTGNDGTNLYNDLWEYTATTNTWVQKASMPASPREEASAFVIGNKAYIGLGLAPGRMNDFWEYDQPTDSWSQKANFAGSPRNGAFGFSSGGKGYFGMGNDNTGVPSRYMYIYDPASDTWAFNNSWAVGGGFEVAWPETFMLNNKFYLAGGHTGTSINSHVWQYDPATNVWIQKAVVGPYLARGASFCLGNKAYIGTGIYANTGLPTTRFWEYVDNVPLAYTYSTNTVPDNAHTITDGKWTITGSTMYNVNAGNVGIGTVSPLTKLDIAGTTRTVGLQVTAFQLGTGAANNYILKSDATGNASWVSMSSIQVPETDPQVGAISTGRVPRWSGSDLTDGSIYDNGGGAIGIGTIPHGTIQTGNGAWNRKVILHEDANNDHQFYGFGIGSGALRYQVANTSASHVFYAGGSAGFSIEIMRMQGNGYVGIGTPGGAQAPLHVAGSPTTAPSQQRAYFHVNTSSIAQDVNASGSIVMRADGWIWANGGGFLATSDARIKDIIGVTDNNADLATLSKIGITNYKYKDEIANGAGLQKKVIAQQVKEIYPIAVNQSTGIIPNVFAIAKQVKIMGNKTTIVVAKPHDLKTGDEVKIILDKSGEQLFTVTVIDAVTFTIPVATSENVFVYGKKVSDLLNVDYDALTTLNISATQQLLKKIEQLEKEMAELKKQLSVFAGK